MNGPLKSEEPVQPPRQHSPPHDRQPQREPLFGPGAGRFLAELIISVVALGLSLLALLLAGSVRNRATSVLFGEAQRTHTLKPSESVLIDGYKVKRVD